MNENNIKIKNNAIIHKDNSLNRLDLSFLKHIELEEYKKSELLAYWINDFAVYHDEERNFNISKSGVFSRGDIIKVNLGFNIGNELGGLHYCVVLGKYDNTRNGTLNVVPLTSKKPNKKYDSSTVNLGNELYILLQEKLDKVLHYHQKHIIFAAIIIFQVTNRQTTSQNGKTKEIHTARERDADTMVQHTGRHGEQAFAAA